jgi:transketolase
MCGMLNGLAYDGIFRPAARRSWSSPITPRPSIRLAALSGLPVLYIFTHDSVGVGEDGPTHQPVETVSGLRVIPNSMSSARPIPRRPPAPSPPPCSDRKIPRCSR